MLSQLRTHTRTLARQALRSRHAYSTSCAHLHADTNYRSSRRDVRAETREGKEVSTGTFLYSSTGTEATQIAVERSRGEWQTVETTAAHFVDRPLHTASKVFLR